MPWFSKFELLAAVAPAKIVWNSDHRPHGYPRSHSLVPLHCTHGSSCFRGMPAVSSIFSQSFEVSSPVSYGLILLS